jgi:pimeloyl-ACP methyl ester carboxylesterase
LIDVAGIPLSGPTSSNRLEQDSERKDDEHERRPIVLLLDDSSEPFKAAGEALRRALPDCRVAVMPGQRHAAMDTATDLFTAQVLSFLEAPDRAR